MSDHHHHDHDDKHNAPLSPMSPPSVSGSQLAPGRGGPAQKLPPWRLVAWSPHRGDDHPIPCLAHPTSGHFSGNIESIHPRTAEVGTVRIPLGKKRGYFVESVGENCKISGTEPQKVRHRVGAKSEDRGKAEKPLHFFDFYAIKLGVTCTVNPQVPGSSPGRGASLVQIWALH